MKNITLSAPEFLIESAREQASNAHSTLNAEFRKWLEQYTRQSEVGSEVSSVLQRIGSYASSGGKRFSREEMNERR